MARSEAIEKAGHSREGGGAGRRTAPQRTCELSFGETAGLRQVTLANGAVRAEILLDKGANVRQFWHVPTGARALAEAQDWTERLAEFHRSGCRGSSYSDCYEGGWQDVLPARAEWEGGATGEGTGVGEAAIMPSELMHAACTPAAAEVRCRARLPRCGLEVAKRFVIRRGVPALMVHTTVRNVSGRDVRLSWTQHPAWGGDLLDDTSRVLLPGGRPVGNREEQGPSCGGSVAVPDPAEHWLSAKALLPTGCADSFLTFANVERSHAALLSPAWGVGVNLRWDRATFPHAWLWSARRESICCIAVEPSTTYLPEMSGCTASPILQLLQPGHSLSTWVELSTFTLASGLSPDATLQRGTYSGSPGVDDRYSTMVGV
jgi:hypothetical protein